MRADKQTKQKKNFHLVLRRCRHQSRATSKYTSRDRLARLSPHRQPSRAVGGAQQPARGGYPRSPRTAMRLHNGPRPENSEWPFDCSAGLEGGPSPAHSLATVRRRIAFGATWWHLVRVCVCVCVCAVARSRRFGTRLCPPHVSCGFQLVMTGYSTATRCRVVDSCSDMA
jgi:hypothetical protein